VISARRAGSDPPVVPMSWPWVILVDPDPTRARRMQTALTKCGFPTVDVVHDVGDVGNIVDRSQQRLALVVLAAGADSAAVLAALRAAGYARILVISSTREAGPIVGAIAGGATGALITSGRVSPTSSVSGVELSWLQIAIVELVAQGRSNNTIAAELGLPETTVKNHLVKIERKFFARDRAHIVALSLRAGIIH